jgi:hypothetical protein
MNAAKARTTPTPNIALEKVPLMLDYHTADKATNSIGITKSIRVRK